MKSGTAKVNDQRLYFERHGEGHPLVLIMGIGYDATLWAQHQIPALSQRYEVIALDNRDAGRSSRASADYTIADMADDVAALLDALEVESAHVVGLSMGGMICQELALRHPNRVSKMVLAGSGGANARSLAEPISVWEFVKEHDQTGAVFGAQQFLWLFSEDFCRNADAVASTADFLATNPNPIDAQAYKRQAAAYVKHDTLDRLGEVNAPTMVICGERDRLTPPWICREVSDAIPNSRFEVVRGPGSSHALPLERPEDFNRLVIEFLA